MKDSLKPFASTPAFLRRTVLLCILLSISVSAASGFTVLVNEGNSAQSLSLNELKDIFQGERTFWGKDQKIHLVVGPKGTPERSFCLSQIYGQTESKFKRHWIGKIFRGEAVVAPKEIPATESLYAYLKERRGAIAIVPSDQVDAASLEGIKVLRIDDKTPADPGYPLTN
jgi:ABC-type phosphate transport system substrate-binding protein